MMPGKIRGETQSWAKPRDWDEELDGECGTLSVRAEKDLRTGLTTLTSLWSPSEEDVEAIRRGQPIMLRIFSEVHPVVSVYVGEPTEHAAWDPDTR